MIEATNITVKFRNTNFAAIENVSFAVRQGEFVAILGPNGSGKSTLLKALCGMISLSMGEINILGKKVNLGGFGRDFFGEIGVVFQEPQGQFLARDVKTELISILQNLGLSLDQQRIRFGQIIEEFKLEPFLDQKPENLSGGQMQLVNLACAICLNPKLLILDEPTTFLDPNYKKIFMELAGVLNKQGKTILHITQYPDESLQANRILVLNSGKLVYEGEPLGFFNDDDKLTNFRLIKPTRLKFRSSFGFSPDDAGKPGEFIEQAKPDEKLSSLSRINATRQPIATIRNLKYRYANSFFALEMDSLNLKLGEIIGIVGPAGSGKSTLALLLAGLLTADSGNIEINSKDIKDYSTPELRRQIGITWQLPDLTMIGPTVKDDLQFGSSYNKPTGNQIAAALKRVSLQGYEDRIVDTLSGGEKRKLGLASILLSDPPILILDEPDAFLDPHSQTELVGILKSLAKEGRSLIVIAHDLEFLSEIADIIVGISEGKVALIETANHFFSNSQLLKRLEMPANKMIEFREKLFKAGIELSSSTLDPEKLRDEIK